MLKQLRYFEKNASQMCYADYREKKFFVGSGVVEAGCRTVIGERLNNRACAGPCVEPMPLLPCVVVSSPADSKIFGPRARRSSHFYLVHPAGIAIWKPIVLLGSFPTSVGGS